MQKREIVAHVLVPADQHVPEAIHPINRALHDPPACLQTGFLLARHDLFPPRPDVGREPELGQQLAHLVVIAFVQAYPLQLLRGGRRARDGDTAERLPDHLEGMPMGSLDGEANRDAAAFGEDAPFGADLPAVGRILAHLFPPQAELWSSRHPWPATPNQCPLRPRIQPGPWPTMPRRHPPPSILGSGDGRNYWNRGRSHSARSTDSRYVGRRKWHPWLDDHQRGGGDTPTGAASGGEAAAG